MMQWFSAAQLAELKLPGHPVTARAWQMRAETAGWLHPRHENVLWRKRAGRGGGHEFSLAAFPLDMRAALVLKTTPAEQQGRNAVLWRNYERLNNAAKERAQRTHNILLAYQALLDNGEKKGKAATGCGSLIFCMKRKEVTPFWMSIT